MLNQSPWLSDRELQDISDTEANLIAGGQFSSVSQLSDVRPSGLTFWGVRTTGGVWTFWWDRATRKFGLSYQFT
ncbi:hypothetical protein NDA07_07000 [Microcoleus vaginatus DQ-U2]|uniref:hypothetical protein n=1 Tax=Microcoleus vaginatus TaxID=119532 RepID=UPI001687621C|nr:hypothetical protein [Microcoleus sp. FACHB-DQ6]